MTDNDTPGYPDAVTLMRRARAETRLDDFGAPTFIAGLEMLLESLAADVPYAPADQARAVALIHRRLVNRLLVEQWFAQNPQAETGSIENPVSIVGLPRTGTTALGNLLSLDPQFRGLRAWEQERPVPPPRIEDEAQDPRRLAYAHMVETLMREDPEQASMHIWETDASVEDTEVLGLEFHAQQMTMPVWRYHAWWRAEDMRPTFAYHARIARLLQSHRPPNRWLFKAPHHKFHLDDMVTAYPDIRFIFTHRDPSRSVPSFASFVASLYPDDVVARIGRERIGREIHEHLLTGMHKAMAARDVLGPDRFLDIHHTDFLAAPMTTLDRIYDWLGLPLCDALRTRFEDYAQRHSAGTHGAHRYTPEQYGLSAAAIRDDYAAYIRAFDFDTGARG